MGTLLVRVTAIGEETFLQQVIRHVEDARALKPGLLHLVDRVLRVYTPTVLAVATLAVIGWWTAARRGGPWGWRVLSALVTASLGLLVIWLSSLVH